MRCATWMFFDHNSRAVARATARNRILHWQRLRTRRRICWRQPLAGVVKYQAGQQARMLCAHASGPLDPVLGKDRLNFVPQRLFDDRWMVSVRYQSA